MAFNAMVGWTIDHYSYWPVFATVAAMHIVSAVLINVFIPRIELITGADQSPVKR